MNSAISYNSDVRLSNLLRIDRDSGDVAVSTVPIISESRYCVREDSVSMFVNGGKKIYGNSNETLLKLSADLPYRKIYFGYVHYNSIFQFDGELQFFNNGTLLGVKSFSFYHNKTGNDSITNSSLSFSTHNWQRYEINKLSKNFGLDFNSNSTYGVSQFNVEGHETLTSKREIEYFDNNTNLQLKIQHNIIMYPYKCCNAADEIKLVILNKFVQVINGGAFGLASTSGGVTVCHVTSQNTPFAL